METEAAFSQGPDGVNAPHISQVGMDDSDASATRGTSPGPTDPKTVLHQIEARLARPLRVLHVGNIANNAYLNAKLLRASGIDCDVLCHDYYHVMATPEWEELEIQDSYGDDNGPRFSRRDLRGFQRPEWFVQGPLPICAAYLDARARGRRLRAWVLWRLLLVAPRSSAFYATTRLVRAWRSPRHLAYYFFRAIRKVALTLARRVERPLLGAASSTVAPPRTLACRFFAMMHRAALAVAETAGRISGRILETNLPGVDLPIGQFSSTFAEVFPERSDRLCRSDVLPWTLNVEHFRRIVRHYDIVQAYATEPILPMLAGKRPYVAYEHGTLRDFTAGDLPLHRLTALAYRLADHAFITNGDCLAVAQRLRMDNFSPMLHPVDVNRHRRIDGARSAAIRATYNSDVLLFCPLRHDWKIKGTDVHIKALPLIKQRLSGRVILLLTSWGADLTQSRALLENIDCTHDVRWLRPLSRPQLVSVIHASDVILDQIALPHFGATAPQALAAGTPVIMSYVPSSTDWIVAEPAPILSAFTPEEVAEQVALALSPDWRGEFTLRARAWIDKYHHHDRIVRDHVAVYRKILG